MLAFVVVSSKPLNIVKVQVQEVSWVLVWMGEDSGSGRREGGEKEVKTERDRMERGRAESRRDR